MPKLKGYTSIMPIDLRAWYMVRCLEKYLNLNWCSQECDYHTPTGEWGGSKP